ncbi:MAG: ferredoxin [Infirmifilum sp.]|uniref:Ferredoxin n=1 Tax=Infirmifilum uzonense TaxID=1550241 RepID=A0A0F7FG72_9CREN|nr:ferredoxin [Infirmifilum uzonense]AKG38127.1 ferredoxin [Infirmifilum uzonense]
MAKLKVIIDRDQCISDMACVSLCPEVFEMSEEDGKSQIVAKYRVGGNPGEGEVPVELEECVKSAAEACPVSIIHVQKIE